MRVLIDTQCWLWLCSEPERFRAATLARLRDPGTERLLSAASIWEIVVKHAIGKLPLPAEPRDFVPTRLAQTQTVVLPITGDHVLRTADLPTHHRDPFDRVIVGQSLAENLPLLSADRLMRKYNIDVIRP